MKEFYDYFHSILLVSPLLFYIVAIAFRLLDNSGYLFLEKEIIIDSSYVSLKNLKRELKNSRDNIFQKKIKRVLVYRKLHRLFILLAILSLPLTIYTYLYLF